MRGTERRFRRGRGNFNKHQHTCALLLLAQRHQFSEPAAVNCSCNLYTAAGALEACQNRNFHLIKLRIPCCFLADNCCAIFLFSEI